MDVIQGNMPAPPPQIGPVGGLRIATIMYIAIFQAVNTIDPRYEPYGGEAMPKVPASLDATAAAAASAALMKLLPADGGTKVAGSETPISPKYRTTRPRRSASNSAMTRRSR